ncbi:phage major tail tube protein [Denitromonas iodatirespirans]|uniref:Phage major tail tube protein n=1 Tax=Denitromonas iodatirespirans TaxID=2795389 RepID=A0A944H7W6_DENI1|nr:phage major tail tube protein [Denitromonas iodatirespirans]MBT0961673.1 phage major tail tube protein [Denitromonas iodatirespirans]
MLPRKLKNFAWFADGVSYVGQASEITLPSLSRKTEEMRNGGMNAPIDSDMGMEGMTMEVTTGLARELFTGFGHPKADGVLWRFTGAYQESTSGAVTAVEIVARGRYKEINMGNAKAGEDAPIKLSMSLAYYKLTIDNEVVVEVDPINFVEVINGEDRLAAQKAALGI